MATSASDKSPLKRHHSKLLFAALAVIPVGLLAQSLAPTPRFLTRPNFPKSKNGCCLKALRNRSPQSWQPYSDLAVIVFQ